MENDVLMALGRVEAKTDILLARTERYGQRLRSVEFKQWLTSGAALVMAAAIAIATSRPGEILAKVFGA